MTKISSCIRPILFAVLIVTAASFGLRSKQEQSSGQSGERANTASPDVQPANNSTSQAPPSQSSGSNSSAPLTNAQVFAKLTPGSVTNLDRVTTIWNDSTFVFDFGWPLNTSLISPGIGGYTVQMTRKDLPALWLSSLSMSVNYIGPCGLHTPHHHSRGNELAFVYSGTFYSGFLAENGAPLVMEFLRPGNAIYFGRGAVHWMANLNCEPALYISGFNDEDPGITNTAQTLFSLPLDVAQSSMGFLDPLSLEIIAAHVPQNITLGIEECIASCALREFI